MNRRFFLAFLGALPIPSLFGLKLPPSTPESEKKTEKKAGGLPAISYLQISVEMKPGEWDRFPVLDHFTESMVAPPVPAIFPCYLKPPNSPAYFEGVSEYRSFNPFWERFMDLVKKGNFKVKMQVVSDSLTGEYIFRDPFEVRGTISSEYRIRSDWAEIDGADRPTPSTAQEFRHIFRLIPVRPAPPWREGTTVARGVG